MKSEIRHLKKYKSCGPSGIGPNQWKYLSKTFPEFMSYVTKAFNAILAKPDCLIQFPFLVKFRAIFIEKAPNKYRPISISVTVLLVFHRLLMKQLKNKTEISKY